MAVDEKHLAAWTDITKAINDHGDIPTIDMIFILSRILGAVASTLPEGFDTSGLEGTILTQVIKGNQIAYDHADLLAKIPSQGRA
jgi:hypothetical protein